MHICVCVWGGGDGRKIKKKKIRFENWEIIKELYLNHFFFFILKKEHIFIIFFPFLFYFF